MGFLIIRGQTYLHFTAVPYILEKRRHAVTIFSAGEGMFVSLSITLFFCILEKSEDKTVNVKIWQCNVPFTESCVLLRANQTQVPVLLESLSGSHGEE